MRCQGGHMKTKIILTILVVFTMVSGFQNVLAETKPYRSNNNNTTIAGKNLRELLVDSKNTVYVVPIDAETTYIEPKKHKGASSSVVESDLSNEIVKWCAELGGRFQIASEDKKEWRDIKIGSDMMFVSPFDKKRYRFNIAYLTEHYKCDGVFTVESVSEADRLRFLYRSITHIESFKIKHKPLPFVAKFKKPAYGEKIRTLLDASSFPAEGSNPILLFSNQDIFVVPSVRLSVFVYMQGLCAKYNGTAQHFLEKNDFLYEATPDEAFESLLKDKKWIFLCSNSNSPTGKFLAKIYKSGMHTKGEFTSNPPVQGLNYIPLSQHKGQPENIE